MSKRQNMSIPDILAIAATRELWVSRYAWSQDRLRKKCRRLCEDGKLEMVRRDNKGFWYLTATATADHSGQEA